MGTQQGQNATLTINGVTEDDRGKFMVKAINPYGEAASSAHLLVDSNLNNEAPKVIEVPPPQVETVVGRPIVIACRFAAFPPFDITWLKNNVIVNNTPTERITIELDFASLELVTPKLSDSGVYMCVLKNNGGQATFTTTLNVVPPPSNQKPPTVTKALKNIVVTEGSKARLDATIVGIPEPECIWYHGGVPVKESKDIKLLFEGDDCALLIKECYLEDAGMYTLRAVNPLGVVVETATLTVEPLSTTSDWSDSQSTLVPPKFTQQLE